MEYNTKIARIGEIWEWAGDELWLILKEHPDDGNRVDVLCLDTGEYVDASGMPVGLFWRRVY